MVLSMGGFGGMIYRCSNCQYTGPLVIEGEDEDGAERETKAYSVSISRLNRNLNWTGLLFGLAFIAIGAVAGFSPLPLSGGRFVGAYGLGLLLVGAMLVAASGLFWLIERSRPTEQLPS